MCVCIRTWMCVHVDVSVCVHYVWRIACRWLCRSRDPFCHIRLWKHRVPNSHHSLVKIILCNFYNYFLSFIILSFCIRIRLSYIHYECILIFKIYFLAWCLPLSTTYLLWMFLFRFVICCRRFISFILLLIKVVYTVSCLWIWTIYFENMFLYMLLLLVKDYF